MISNKKILQAMKHPDTLGAGAKKRKQLKLNKNEYFETIMKEWKRGTLYSGSGVKVKSKKQAIAIAFRGR